MKNNALRAALSTGLVLLVVAAACAPGCSGSDAKKVPFDPDASAGDAGESGDSGGNGSAAHGGNAGSAASGGDAGSSVGGNGGGSAAGSGATGEAGAAASAGAAGDGDPGESLPDLDAGNGCMPPSDLTLLSPASEGVPAAGLALWLRADRGVYLTADQRVCAWVDQSGHDRVFAPANDSTRPLWAGAGVGARPAVHFDASDHYLSTSGVLDIPGASARTLIAVVKLVNLGTRCPSLQQGQPNTRGTYLMLDANTFNTTGNLEGVYVTNNAYDSTLATSASPRVHVYTLSTMVPSAVVLGSIDYRVNGITQTLTRTPGGLGTDVIEDFSAASYTLVGACTEAFIAEALVYDRALSVPERVAVEASLEARYGID